MAANTTATKYIVATAEATYGEPASRKEYAVKQADKLAAETPGTEFHVATSKGKVVHTALVAAPVETPAEAATDLHIPAEGEGVYFLVAKRLSDYIIENAADYRADVVAALQVGETHRSTGQGHQVHIETTETTAKAMRRIFKELHLGLEAGLLDGLTFRTSTTARHIGRIDFALDGGE